MIQNEELDNTLLALLWEFKTGGIDANQAIKEIKQAIEYYNSLKNKS